MCCIYFVGLYMLRGVYFVVLVSIFLLIYDYEFFIIICLYCLCLKSRFLFFLYLYFFLHMRLCILFKCFRKYTGWFIWAAVYSYNWWIVVRLNLCFWALFCKGLLLVYFELFKLCFVTDCQRGSLLGSKDLGFMYLES